MQLSLFPEASFLVRIDARANMWRFYDMTIQPDLYGGAALMRRWGRLGTPGVLRLDLFPDAGAASNALARLAARKLRKGYCSRS